MVDSNWRGDSVRDGIYEAVYWPMGCKSAQSAADYGVLTIHCPMMATGMPYLSRRIVMLKHVLMTRYSSSFVGVGAVRPVLWVLCVEVIASDWVTDCGSWKSGTFPGAAVGGCAGVLVVVRDGCARVRDNGILSVQCVYM